MKTELLSIFDSKLDDKYYLESLGFNCSVPVYRNFTHNYAKLFFTIIDKLNLDYYVFAGTSIGYIRNKQNIPWVDDYDIIIFDNEIYKFENIVLPKLKEYGFNCFTPCTYNKELQKAGYHVLSSFDQKCFQCDVFYTKVNNDGIIKNVNNCWGLYNYKNIPENIVKPKQYLTIDDDLTIPFFNNITKDIEIEYGDVCNVCVFHINHEENLKIKNNFKIVYNEFNNIKNQIIQNTIQLFQNHKYINNMTIDSYEKFFENNNQNDFNKTITFLKYINEHNVKNLYIMDDQFLLFCVDLKFYFKDINIHFYIIKDIESKNIMLLNYVDKILYSKIEYINNLNNLEHFLEKLQKKIEVIKVITFGTYDLFHIGHTKILERAKHYGELVVGVSTDELNNRKGKVSVNNLEKRKLDVYNTNYASVIFNEESLEFKNEYIKKYNCNLLIMGDDWKDAFNFCDCACLYLPRTPNISTTLLKQQINFI